MNTSSFLLAFLLLLFSACNFPKTSARTKTLKIIIPSKVRYVHHHHTHVLVMKDKKPHRGPDAKYHHLHFYDPNGRKGRDTNHYFIPYIPPQAEDEADEETADSYAVTAPKRGSYFHAGNYRPASTKQPPQIYDEPDFHSSSKKYRLYSRADVPQIKYLQTDPISSLKQDDSEEPVMKEENEDDHGFRRESNRSYDLGRMDLYETEPLLYPRKGLYSNKRIRYILKSSHPSVDTKYLDGLIINKYGTTDVPVWKRQL